jgi:hypothetical protein
MITSRSEILSGEANHKRNIEKAVRGSSEEE